MRICQVTSLHKRYDIRIFQKYAISNAQAGHESILVCADMLDDEEKEGVKIYSVKKTFKNRLSRILFSKKVMLKKVLSVDADIYQLHDPDLLFLAKKLAKKKKKVIFDSHEDYSTYMLNKEWIPKIFRKMVQRSYNRIQRNALQMISGVIAVNDEITNKLRVYNKNAITVNNYPKLFQEVKHSYNKALCFAGLLCESYNHEKIVNLLEKYNGDITYNLAGDPNSEYFENVMKLPGFKFVNFKGQLTNKEVIEMYEESSIGLAISDYIPNFNYKKGSMGVIKIFEYMMAGLPIVATDFELWKPIIEGNEIGPVGICVSPNDDATIENAILKLANDKELQKQYGTNGRKLVEKYYNWNILNEKVQQFYKEINKEEGIR